MITIDKILELHPYSIDCGQKKELLTDCLTILTEEHKRNCEPYRKIIELFEVDTGNIKDHYDIPFLPVRIFKDMELCSVPQNEIVKTLTSSGTTGQKVSKIYLDRVTSIRQQKALIRIVSDFTGKSRMPMLIIDSPSVIKNRAMFSARGAGILGFSVFATDRKYALDENMELDLVGIQAFLDKHAGKKILVFGFTYIIWRHFYKELLKSPGIIDLSNAVLIHGGGWKKLLDESVSPQELGQRLRDVCGLADIHDYYGMAEQTGSIYMQCACGHLHASIFSDVIIRRVRDFSIADIGEKGIIQTVSILPKSYPGHSILTEDVGVLLGEDDCPCGRKGRYFKVVGRLKDAEVRGCSDTYE